MKTNKGAIRVQLRYQDKHGGLIGAAAFVCVVLVMTMVYETGAETDRFSGEEATGDRPSMSGVADGDSGSRQAPVSVFPPDIDSTATSIDDEESVLDDEFTFRKMKRNADGMKKLVHRPYLRFHNLTEFIRAVSQSSSYEELLRNYGSSATVNRSHHLSHHGGGKMRPRARRNGREQCSPRGCDELPYNTTSTECLVRDDSSPTYTKRADDAIKRVQSDNPVEKCEPIPHVIYMNNICDSMQDGLQYHPALQIVHRCRKTAISCLHQEQYYEPSHDNCRPKPEKITRFSKSFIIIAKRLSNPNDGLIDVTGVETFTFENHTECQCDESDQSDEDDSDLGQSTSPNEGSVNDLPSTESTEGRDVTTSKAADRPHDIATFKVMMRCPQPFKRIVKNNKNRCVCKCGNKDFNCLCKRIADGRNGLKRKDIRCIHKNQCLLPKCLKSRIYDLRTGYCIPKNPSKTSQQHPKPSTTASPHLPSRSNRLTT